MVREISGKTFKTKLKNAGDPFLVEFTADWCRPCKLLEPVLDEVERSGAGSPEIVKIDVEKEKQISEEFKVRAIPHLALISKGRIVDRAVGNIPKLKVQEMLSKR